MDSKEIVFSDLVRGLKALGVGPKGKFIIHSSLKMMGYVDGGAETVIDALKSLVTEDGTIMMPAFAIPPAEIFDIDKTPTTLGVIAETFRNMPNVVRSLHPTHSVAIWGNDKERYKSAHLFSTALGYGSPIHLIIEDGGDILLLGVGHWANSAIHVAEAIAQVTYLDLPYSEEYARPLSVRMPDGTIREFTPNENPGCSINFISVDGPLKKAGHVKYERVGDALIQRVDGRGLLSLVSDILKENPGALLCKWELCPFCPRARELIKEKA